MALGIAGVQQSGVAAVPNMDDSAAQNSTKLNAAAREFESILLGQWLQSAESSFGSVPGGDEDMDSGGDQMRSFGVQQLAGQLTASGGIGIAKMVENALVKTSQHEHLSADESSRSASFAESTASKQNGTSAALNYSGR